MEYDDSVLVSLPAITGARRFNNWRLSGYRGRAFRSRFGVIDFGGGIFGNRTSRQRVSEDAWGFSGDFASGI